MIEDERVGDAARIVALPATVGVALLALSAWVAGTPDGERMVMVLLGLCCACLIVGAGLVATRSRRLEVALSDAREHQGPDRTCPVGLFRVDGDGRCTWVSDGWCDLTGRARESALGERWEDVLRLHERRQARRAFQQAVVSERSLPLDHTVVRADGEETHVVGQLSREGTGRYVGVFTAIEDRPAAQRRAA